MPRLNASNNASTSLNGGIDGLATSFVVEDSSLFPDPPFRVTIDAEIIEVGAINRSTHVFSNLTRGCESTVASAHSHGATVTCRFTAGMYSALMDSSDTENAIENYTRMRQILLTAGGALIPSSGGAGQQVVYGTNFPYLVLAYDKDTQEKAYWCIPLPSDLDSTEPVTFTVVFLAPTQASGTVRWLLKTAGRTAGTVWDASLGTSYAVEAPVSSAGTLAAASFPATVIGWTAGGSAIVEITRDATHTNDTLGEDAYLLFVHVSYTGK